jgi:hypothetical protein
MEAKWSHMKKSIPRSIRDAYSMQLEATAYNWRKNYRNDLFGRFISIIKRFQINDIEGESNDDDSDDSSNDSSDSSDSSDDSDDLEEQDLMSLDEEEGHDED